jgi:hypothetical protein
MRPALIRECQRAELRHQFTRVENQVNDGDPDVDYCIAGVCGKLELKYSDSHPANPTSKLVIRHGLRRSQIIYASKRSWAGGLIWCLIGSPVDAWLIDLRKLAPTDMDKLVSASLLELTARARWRLASDGWQALPGALLGR